MNIQDWFPLGLTCLISLLSKGLPRVFSSTTILLHSNEQWYCKFTFVITLAPPQSTVEEPLHSLKSFLVKASFSPVLLVSLFLHWLFLLGLHTGSHRLHSLSELSSNPVLLWTYVSLCPCLVPGLWKAPTSQWLPDVSPPPHTSPTSPDPHVWPHTWRLPWMPNNKLKLNMAKTQLLTPIPPNLFLCCIQSLLFSHSPYPVHQQTLLSLSPKHIQTHLLLSLLLPSWSEAWSITPGLQKLFLTWPIWFYYCLSWPIKILSPNFIEFYKYRNWIMTVKFSCSVVSDSLWPHGLQHTRLSCPSPTPRAYSIKLTSIKLVMPSNHLIVCRPLLLLPSIFPSIRAFSSESVLPPIKPFLCIYITETKSKLPGSSQNLDLTCLLPPSGLSLFSYAVTLKAVVSLSLQGSSSSTPDSFPPWDPGFSSSLPGVLCPASLPGLHLLFRIW